MKSPRRHGDATHSPESGFPEVRSNVFWSTHPIPTVATIDPGSGDYVAIFTVDRNGEMRRSNVRRIVTPTIVFSQTEPDWHPGDIEPDWHPGDIETRKP